VVDIGSNSVRLVVYARLSGAPFPRFNEKSLCRLGAGLAQTGELSADGFRRTLEAVRRFRAISDAMGVSRIDVIATEAIRIAANGGQLVSAIRRETGLEVRVLSGMEEAHFAALGVLAGVYQRRRHGRRQPRVAEIAGSGIRDGPVSLPLGSLPVEAMLASGGRDAREQIDALLEKLPRSLTNKVFYAVGGGWRAFAQMHMGAVDAPVRVAHGYTLDAEEARYEWSRRS
jgi:exopolyphosphatase/guanosine-5'-triphosphate,3'-diphosphate pyrophosphatase